MNSIALKFGPAPEPPATPGGSSRSRFIQKALPKLAPQEGQILLPRVCLYTDSDVFAGTEAHILDLAQGMKRLGVPVRIAAPIPANTSIQPSAVRVMF